MTPEEFITIQIDNHLINQEKCIIVRCASGFLSEMTIDLINPQTGVWTRDALSLMDGYNQNGIGDIGYLEIPHWEFYRGPISIKNLEFRIFVLMYELTLLKRALHTVINIPPYKNYL